MITNDALREVMRHHALAGSAFVANGFAAVDEVGVPDQHVAFLAMKCFFLKSILLNNFGNFILIISVRIGAKHPTGITGREIFFQHKWQAVTAGIVKQWTVARMAIFQRNPGGDQITARLGGHVNKIRMRALFAAFHEIYGLKGNYHLAKGETKQLQ